MYKLTRLQPQETATAARTSGARVQTASVRLAITAVKTALPSNARIHVTVNTRQADVDRISYKYVLAGFNAQALTFGGLATVGTVTSPMVHGGTTQTSIGTVTLSLSPTVSKASLVVGPSVPRPSDETILAEVRKLNQAEWDASWGRYPSHARRANGTIITSSDDTGELVYTPLGPMTYLQYLYGASLFSTATPVAYADAQIRAGLLLEGHSDSALVPASTAAAADATTASRLSPSARMRVLCQALVALPQALSSVEERGGAAYSYPLGDESLETAAMVCVELSTLPAFTAAQIRRSTSPLSRALQPLLAGYRVAHLVCTAREGRPGVNGAATALQTRHLVAMLIPRSLIGQLSMEPTATSVASAAAAAATATAAPVGAAPLLCRLLETLGGPHEFAADLRAAGSRSRGEPFTLVSDLLPIEADTSFSFEGKGRYYGSAFKLLLVDEPDDGIIELTCLSRDASTGVWGIGIDMRAFFLAGLDVASHRLVPTTVLTPTSPALTVLNATYDEVRYASNVGLDVDNPLALSADRLRGLTAEINAAKLTAAGEGWHVGLIHVRGGELIRTVPLFARLSEDLENTRALIRSQAKGATPSEEVATPPIHEATFDVVEEINLASRLVCAVVRLRYT